MIITFKNVKKLIQKKYRIPYGRQPKKQVKQYSRVRSNNIKYFKYGRLELQTNSPLKLGPEKYILSIEFSNDSLEDWNWYCMTITSKYVTLSYRNDYWRDIFEVQDYSEDEQFTLSLLHPFIPSSNDIRMIREYFKKYYTNKISTIKFAV